MLIRGVCLVSRSNVDTGSVSIVSYVVVVPQGWSATLHHSYFFLIFIHAVDDNLSYDIMDKPAM